MKPNEARMVIRKCSLTPLSKFHQAPLWRTSSSRVGAKCCSTSSGGEVEHWSAWYPRQGSSFSTWLGFHHAARGADNQATGSGGKTARRDAAREEKRQLTSKNGETRETVETRPSLIHSRLLPRLWKMHGSMQQCISVLPARHSMLT